MESTARPSQPLSMDDVLMGEILISLKRTAVVQPPSLVQPSSLSSSYRSKVDLTVEMPALDAPATTAAALATPFHTFATVSPIASTAYTNNISNNHSNSRSIGATHSPTERSKRFGPVVQLDDLRECFNMPIAAVARKFGICATLLKKICRRHGIQRWPHRQIRSLQKSIDLLRESLAVAKGSNRDYISKKIAAFEYTLECIMADPNTAAKGISAGRLASPAGEELAKRGSRSSSTAKSSTAGASSSSKKITSSSALAAALSEDDIEIDMDDEVASSRSAQVPPMHVWSPTASPQRSEERSVSMSLKSILC